MRVISRNVEIKFLMLIFISVLVDLVHPPVEHLERLLEQPQQLLEEVVSVSNNKFLGLLLNSAQSQGQIL